MDAMLKIEIPEPFSFTYLALLNAGERLVENLEDIKMYETDPILALSGISQYEKNATGLGEAIVNLINEVNQKLRN